MKNVALILAVGVGGLAVWSIYPQRTTKGSAHGSTTQQVESAVSEDAAPAQSADTLSLDRALARLRNVEQKLDELKPRQSQAERAVEQDAPSYASDDPPPLPTGAALVQRLDEHFGNAPVGADWAKATRDSLQQALTVAMPQGSSIVDIDCKDTLCRISSQHASADTFQNWVHASFIEGKTWEGDVAAQIVDDQRGHVSTVAFLARPGMAMPEMLDDSH